MAASLLCSVPALSLNLAGPSVGLRKSPFLSGKIAAAPPPCSGSFRRSAFRSGVLGETEVPKQFREENLKDGLIENFKNVPRTLYGLPESQMHSLFMKGDNHLAHLTEQISVERLASSDWSYSNIVGNMDTLTDVVETGMDSYYMRMARGPRRGSPRGGAPDLPSVLLDNRIVYIGMPILPEVTELIVAELMFLDYIDNRSPIYLYLNCTGTQEDNEIVGAETDAFAIVDTMDNLGAPVYTMNLSQAHGQAAMLLARGKKGHRGFLKHSMAKVHLPSVYYSSGFSTDMWTKGKDLDSDTHTFLELLSKGTEKSKEELERDLRNGPKYLLGKQMIEYGIADRLISSIQGNKNKTKATKLVGSPRKLGIDTSSFTPKSSP